MGILVLDSSDVSDRAAVSAGVVLADDGIDSGVDAVVEAIVASGAKKSSSSSSLVMSAQSLRTLGSALAAARDGT